MYYDYAAKTLVQEPGIEPRPPAVLLAVDDDPGALAAIGNELRKRYGADYQIMGVGSPEEALARLRALEAGGAEVAMILADQWMPGMPGAELLARAHRMHPTARRVLLVAWGEWSDRATVDAILGAMALGHIDSYALKPWRSPDERFHRTITECLNEWAWGHPSAIKELCMVGERHSARAHELRDLLQRNGIPHSFYTPDSSEGRELLVKVGAAPERLPLLVLLDGRVLADPSNAELADAYAGAPARLSQRTFDLIVIGAGPAGLAAAVYGASEGLSTLVLEREAIGGQAGTSSLIRNYLGFPWGIGGADLTRRAFDQAWLFGAAFCFRQATALRRSGPVLVMTLSDGVEVTGRSVLVATGASYRRLGVPSLVALQGTGVFYGPAVAEAPSLRGQEVYVVGAGNSAGQAAMHLSRYAGRVTIVVRDASLAARMSDYLITEVEAADNVEVRTRTRVTGGGGDGRLEHLVLEDAAGRTETVPASALFVLVGVGPLTAWLPTAIERDRAGFIITGDELVVGGTHRRGWQSSRHPLPLETSMPGVFAAGDARDGSVKRVASAAGEGSAAVGMIHEYLRLAARPNRGAGVVAPRTVAGNTGTVGTIP